MTDLYALGAALVLAGIVAWLWERVGRLERAQWPKVEVRAVPTDDERAPYVVFPFDGHTEALEPFLARHDTNMAGAVWVHPDRYGGRPCVGGHRITVDDVVNIADGEPDGDLLADEYGVTAEQVRVARWFVANYPSYPFTAEDLEPGTLTARNATAGTVGSVDGVVVGIAVADPGVVRRGTHVAIVEITGSP